MATPALGKLKEQGLAAVRGMSRRGQIFSVLALVATVGLLIYIVGVDRTEYATLFSGLAERDAGRITERLKKDKVPFRLVRGGGAIEVPAARVHELRLQMASAGLPRGGSIGFEIFDKQKLGVSDFAQQVNYRRALQGELERTIVQIDAIKSARVHLAMPRRQLFARSSRPVSASVTVRLLPGRVVSKGTVRAVVHLVSSAVSGLRPEAISVMDTRGRLLWGGKSGDRSAQVDGFLDYQNKFECSLERRVAEILDRALGPGRSVVKVTADLKTSSSEQTEERFDPERVAVRSESRSEESAAGKRGRTAGVAGVAGNLPGASGPRGGANTRGSKSKRLTRNYEVSKVVRRQRQPAGELRRLSVAVLIDKASLEGRAAGKAGGKAGGKAKGLSIDLAALELVVQQAVGFTAARGDIVTLRAVPFAVDQPLPVPVVPLWRQVGESSWPRIVGLTALALIVLLVLWRATRRGDGGQLVALPATVRELEAARPLRATAQREDQPEGLEQGVQARELAEAATEHDSRRAAQVLRVWLAGG